MKDVEFADGVVEVDIAVDGGRSYPGIIFRVQSEEDYERFYLRPHRSGLYPDALQYAPVFNRVACWQLYSGKGFTTPAVIPTGQWIHLKMEIHGRQARVFVGDAEDPALVIHDLKHGLSRGSVGVLGPKNKAACFSNFRYRVDDSLEFEDPPEVETPSHTLTDWEISRAFPAGRIDRESYPDFFLIFYAQWRKVTSEASGLVNISRYAKRSSQGPDCVLARTIVQSDKRQDVRLSFGYSDDVSIFLNGKIVFSGRSGYRSRDPSFVGVVGLHDAVHLTLQKGLNEILLLVTESFGGWGFMCKADRRLDGPIRQHGRLTKVWETPAEFKIPESVLYDPEREILYVTSFNKVGRDKDHIGFISKVELDGEIEDLEWVTGLDGPCGMGIYEDKLFVVECSGNLVEIDIDRGSVSRRYPIAGSTFLNDVAVDRSGNIYITDSTRPPEGRDIYRFIDGDYELWKDGDEIHRSNGLFVRENNLIVGNTGDGSLKSVGLNDGRVNTIACLGAGVVDGIRVDNDGNYIVSHWEGQVYLISPSGEVVEILDTMNAGLNAADFEFIKEKNLLVVPTFLGNKVVAYELAAGVGSQNSGRRGGQ